MTAACDGEPLAVDAALQCAIHRFKKVIAVVLGVEAEEVVAQHPIENFAWPTGREELLGIRPGNMPELRDDQVGPRVLEQSRGSRAK